MLSAKPDKRRGTRPAQTDNVLKLDVSNATKKTKGRTKLPASET